MYRPTERTEHTMTRRRLSLNATSIARAARDLGGSYNDLWAVGQRGTFTDREWANAMAELMPLFDREGGDLHKVILYYA